MIYNVLYPFMLLFVMPCDMPRQRPVEDANWHLDRGPRLARQPIGGPEKDVEKTTKGFALGTHWGASAPETPR